MKRRLFDYPELQSAARDRQPRVALVLGSGLSDLADRLRNVVELPFGLAPGLDTTSVSGHRGVLLLGTWVDVPVLIFAGRLHYYEGHPWRRVVQPIHLAQELGASTLVVTNAAGGIRADLSPGDLLAIEGHLEWTRPNAWREWEMPRSEPYSPRLLAFLRRAGLCTGVYAQLTGPCYETPAEIRALRHCGADAVGMSTAREIATGFALGMECAAISCITNKAAGLGTGPIHHDEVLQTGRAVKERLAHVLEELLVEI